MISAIFQALLQAAMKSHVEFIGEVPYSSNKALLERVLPLYLRGSSGQVELVTGLERVALSAPSGIDMYVIREDGVAKGNSQEVTPVVEWEFSKEEYLEASDGRVVAILARKSRESDSMLGISSNTTNEYNVASCQGEAKIDAIRRSLAAAKGF